jgi:hypothetical protein
MGCAEIEKLSVRQSIQYKRKTFLFLKIIFQDILCPDSE